MARTMQKRRLVYVRRVPAANAAKAATASAAATSTCQYSLLPSPPDHPINAETATSTSFQLPRILSVEEYEEAQKAYWEYRKRREAALKKRFAATIDKAKHKIIEVAELKKTLRPVPIPNRYTINQN